MSETPILNLPTGLRFQAGTRVAQLEPISVPPAQWIAITPEAGFSSDEPSPPIARLLVTLGGPIAGAVELHGQALKSLSYVELQGLRKRLGFVVCRGGLLSNRTVAENVALPISVHAHLGADEERSRVAQLLADFDLERVATRRPDDVDGATRFRACVARALALSPPWVVIEGTGDFAQPGSRTWAQLDAYRIATQAALAVCLPAPDPRFEEWLAARGGRVLRYQPISEAI